MNLDISSLQITVVVAPIDLRAGFSKLSTVAQVCLDINVDAGKDAVVFISSTRQLCKIIWSDRRGTVLLSRRLHVGRYQQLMRRLDESDGIPLSFDELMLYLNGTDVLSPKGKYLH